MVKLEGLVKFEGRECVHCHRMDPLDERVEQELGIKIQRIEVWHNADNARMLEEYDKGFCGGVPFYFNTKTDKWICGEVPYEKLKKWAQGK